MFFIFVAQMKSDILFFSSELQMQGLSNYISLSRELKKLSTEKQAEASRRFFKTGPGAYGEGDEFIGVKVPLIREIAKRNLDLEHLELNKLLDSPIHEERMLAVIILTMKYQKFEKNKNPQGALVVLEHYLRKIERVNNWDLVDVSAPTIVGGYCLQEGHDLAIKLSDSSVLWSRRIAIVSTLRLIKADEFKLCFQLSKKFLTDEHDLIHKACGWMLREAGKRNEQQLLLFLDKHFQKMPRTMLRYSIEKLSPKLKKKYMAKVFVPSKI